MRIAMAALVFFLFPAWAFAHGNAESQSPVPEKNAAIESAARTVDAFHDALTKGDRQAVQALVLWKAARTHDTPSASLTVLLLYLTATPPQGGGRPFAVD